MLLGVDMQRALNEIVARHEQLRVCFVEREGVPLAKIAATLAVPLASVNLEQRPADEREREFEALARAQAEALARQLGLR